MAKVVPIFRIFDYAKVIEFYIDWLGFEITFEHKNEGAPIYMQVSLGDISIDLTEHHGDCSPGAKIFIKDFKGLREFHASLIEKNYTFNRPGLEIAFWDKDVITMTVQDPFFNRIEFTERITE